MNVPFLDLGLIHDELRDEITTAMNAVLDTGAFVLGPAVERFEDAFAAAVGRRHCIAVNSGTSALHLALLGLGVAPGDEVITTPHTFIATSWAISYCGATPVFVDVDPRTGNLDPAATEHAITSRTRAILPVDLYGNPCELPAFEELAERKQLALLDDACQAHGATLAGRPVGSFGDAACFSFYPGKNLGAAGEGGAVVTDDDAMSDRLRHLRHHAQAANHHHVEIGFNYRMEGLQGAFLGVKLPHLARWNAQRVEAAQRYDDLLADVDGVVPPTTNPAGVSNFHLYVITTDARDAVMAAMQAKGVDVRSHYPTPIHLQPAYAGLGYAPGSFPEAERFAAQCISLPMFPGITPEQQEVVVRALADAVAEVARHG